MMSSVLTNRIAWEKCTHLYGETKGNNETQTLSTENFLRQVQEDRQKKEAKKTDKKEQNKTKIMIIIKNVYVNFLTKIRKIKWADRAPPNFRHFDNVVLNLCLHP